MKSIEIRNLFILFAFTALWISPVARAGDGNERKPVQVQRAEREANRLTRILYLDDEQSSTIYELIVNFSNDKLKAKEDLGLSTRAYRKELRRLQGVFDDGMRSLLNAEQYQKFTDLR